ncbi:MAG: tetratricopeptide repeat protein [Gammaproteobacteria bacterium]|nr:tetratricopeptide repeat protein [Gammaproteobacteria bacterium]
MRPTKLPDAWLLVTLLLGECVAVILVYWPGMHAGFYFDDHQNIVGATALHLTDLRVAAISEAMQDGFLRSRPIANLSMALNHLFGSLEPKGYHWTNLVIHLAVGLALFNLLVQLSIHDRRSMAVKRTAILCAAIVTFLYLLHPLNIQAVTYVVQRMSSMATLFSLIAFTCYIRARRRPTQLARVTWFSCSLLSWMLAVGSKEVALAMPVVVLLYELAFHREQWQRLRARLNHPCVLWPAAVMVLSVSALTIYLVWNMYHLNGVLHWHEPFTNRDFNGYQRVLTQLRVQFFYLGLLLWPAPSRLNLDHEFSLSLSLTDPWSTAIALGAWLVIIAATIWLFRKHPRYGFPLLAYLTLHLMESGPLNLELVFEHRMYLPMTMLAVLLTNILVDLKPHQRNAPLSVIVFVLPLLGYATYQRNVVWADPLVFHDDCARKSPNKFRPQYNLGTVLGMAGRYSEAQRALNRALALNPEHSEAHNQLANTYVLTGNTSLALSHYRRAVALNPGNAEAVFNLAQQLDSAGRLAEAVEGYRHFLTVAPPYLAPQIDSTRRRLAMLGRAISNVPSRNQEPAATLSNQDQEPDPAKQ